MRASLLAIVIFVETVYGEHLRLSAMSNDTAEPRYRERESLFRLYAREFPAPRPIVFLGDSIVERCERQELLGASHRVVNREAAAAMNSASSALIVSVPPRSLRWAYG